MDFVFASENDWWAYAIVLLGRKESVGVSGVVVVERRMSARTGLPCNPYLATGRGRRVDKQTNKRDLDT